MTNPIVVPTGALIDQTSVALLSESSTVRFIFGTSLSCVQSKKSAGGTKDSPLSTLYTYKSIRMLQTMKMVSGTRTYLPARLFDSMLVGSRV